jgi:predicted DNA-binding transcriptional regulator YafY
MRADRLLSILLLLQTRGRLTAQALSREVEVSVRTIYRDIDALCQAGVPIYTERGPGGGFTLLESYRTNLTGLTHAEIRALFSLGVPSALEDLGLAHELRSAMLKLSAALPTSRREDQLHIRQRLHLDASWWFQSGEPVPHLPTIQQAVWDDLELRLTRRLDFDALLEREIAPYGLVAKAGVWYLVWARDDHLGVTPLSDVVDAQATDRSFTRPRDFDLAAFWRRWSAAYESSRPSYSVTLRVTTDVLPHLRYLFGVAFSPPPEPSNDGDRPSWTTVTLEFGSFHEARSQVLGLGRAVEVIAPRALRASVVDFAQQITAMYGALDDHPSIA